MKRRTLLRGLVGVSALGSAGTAINRMSGAGASAAGLSVTVLLDEPIGTIRPAIYSQFAEHIGGVIYDGIWVGPDSKVPNIGGFRKTLVEHVKRLGNVVVRWPGGCFADRYHWRDGIGPVATRPRRFGRWREVTESNTFGTHEFIRFCRLCGVEPYFAANVGTGSPEEFQQWVEYCNAPSGSTTLADERAANGEREPLGIRYWGVGNESWGCGGKFTPEDYCREYRKFTEWLPEYGVKLYLIAAGPNSNDLDWTRRFFTKWADGAKAPIQGWSPHYYCGTTGHALNFTTEQWYEQLYKADQMEKLIGDQWAVLGLFDPDHKIKLVVDEWGSWHPAGTEINPAHLFEQMGTLRDCAGGGLDPRHVQPTRRQGGHGEHCATGEQSALVVSGRRREVRGHAQFPRLRDVPSPSRRPLSSNGCARTRAGVRSGQISQADFPDQRLGLASRPAAIDADTRAHARHRSGRSLRIPSRRISTRGSPGRPHT